MTEPRSCRRATARISAAMDGPLPAAPRLRLLAHLACCGPCRRYRGQLALLRRLLRAGEAETTIRLSPDARRRLVARLREAIERG